MLLYQNSFQYILLAYTLQQLANDYHSLHPFIDTFKAIYKIIIIIKKSLKDERNVQRGVRPRSPLVSAAGVGFKQCPIKERHFLNEIPIILLYLKRNSTANKACMPTLTRARFYK